MKKLLHKILPYSLFKAVRKNWLPVKWLLYSLAGRILIALRMPLKRRHKKIRFEIHIAEHCNLNCRSCSNFSPIAEPELVSLDEFRRDFERLGGIFSHECERIYLLGGEPLLHPEIIALMKIARECFTQGEIYIFTNGILLPGKDDEFWKACHDYNIGILISAYPIKIDIDGIKSKAEKFGVDCKYAWGQRTGELDEFDTFPMNLKGNGNIKHNFFMCTHANNCIVLSHGRLFTCVFAAHVHHFNKRFGSHVNITENDSVNIYDDISGGEILKRLSEPIPACAYCDRSHPYRKIKWGLSKKTIDEWL